MTKGNYEKYVTLKNLSYFFFAAAPVGEGGGPALAAGCTGAAAAERLAFTGVGCLLYKEPVGRPVLVWLAAACAGVGDR